MAALQKVILNTLEQEIVELTHDKYFEDINQEDYEDTAKEFIRWLVNQYKVRKTKV